MSKRKFTKEERERLSENPYTMLVTENTLSFTIEFKELFWKDHCKGMTARQIVSKYGYDPELLGSSRLEGLQYTIKKAALNGRAFTNVAMPAQKPDSIDGSPRTQETDIKQLEQKVKYLEQEVEYLKKFSSVRTSRK